MSEPKITNVDPYESYDSQDPNYIPSQTPESEDYTSYESSSLETPSESDYSIASINVREVVIILHHILMKVNH